MYSIPFQHSSLLPSILAEGWALSALVYSRKRAFNNLLVRHELVALTERGKELGSYPTPRTTVALWPIQKAPSSKLQKGELSSLVGVSLFTRLISGVLALLDSSIILARFSPTSCLAKSRAALQFPPN